MCRRTKAKEFNDSITAANSALQAFKLKELEQQREADKAMEGERCLQPPLWRFGQGSTGNSEQWSMWNPKRTG